METKNNKKNITIFMKNKKSRSLFQIPTVVKFLLPLLLTLSSCKFFQSQPLEDYLNEYTNTAAIVSHTFEKEYPVDKDGIINIPSAFDVNINLLLRNPQKYRIICTPELVDSTSQKVRTKVKNATNSDPYTIIQDKTDTSLAHMKFTSDFLVELEGGGDISSILTLQGFTSDGVPLSFENQNYSDFIVKVNTQPEPIKNFQILQDNTNNTYVLAFNMPDMSGIHKDTSKIIINDSEFPIEVTETNPVGIDITKYKAFTTDLVYGATLKDGKTENTYTGITQPRCIFYKTNKPFTQEQYSVNITLEDKSGLQVSSIVNTKSEKLSQVTFNEDELIGLVTGDDGYAYVQLNAPKVTENGTKLNEIPTVYYVVYDANDKLAKQGSFEGDTKITLGSGNWKIETWAQLPGYISNELTTKEIQVTGWQYINPLYTDTIKDGGKQTPYTSIQEALKATKDSGMTKAYIVLLEDITLTSPITLEGFNLHIKSDNATIKNTHTNNESFTLSSNATQNSTIIIENTVVQGNITLANANSSVYINGTSRIESITQNKDTNIYLENIDITNNKENLPIATINHTEKLENGLLICKAAGEYIITEDVVKLIRLTDSYYRCQLSIDDNTIRVIEAMISIEIPDIKDYRVTFSCDDFELLEPSIYKLQVAEQNATEKTTTIVAQIQGDAGDGNWLPMNDIDVELSLLLTDFPENTIATNKNSISVPIQYFQAYTLIAKYTVNGIANSEMILLKVGDFIERPISEVTVAPTKYTQPRLAMSQASELQKVADWVKNGSDMEGVTITLTEDVDVSEINDFKPIGIGLNDYFNEISVDNGGGTVTHFNGVFEGNGKTIRLNVDRIDIAQQVSLFAVNEGTIQNVVVEQFSESGEFGHENQSYGTRVAGICIFNNGIIKNCIVKANMKTGNQGDMAGICINNNGTIINCAYTGTIENTRNFLWGENCIQRVGGIAATNNGTIINCINTGTLINSLAYNTTSVQGPTGGIVAMQTKKTGDLDPKVQNCYWRRNNCTINTNPQNYLVQKAEFTLNTGYEKFYPNPTPETITACGYFTSLSEPTVTAGDIDSCGINQTLAYPAKTSVIDKLNAFVDEDTTYGDLKKWKVVSGKLEFEEE